MVEMNLYSFVDIAAKMLLSNLQVKYATK